MHTSFTCPDANVLQMDVDVDAAPELDNVLVQDLVTRVQHRLGLHLFGLDGGRAKSLDW